MFCLHRNRNGAVLRAIKAEPKERKLRACWSPEVCQDLRYYYRIDAIAELVAVLSQEIAWGEQRHIINLLYQNAGNRTAWSFAKSPGDTINEKIRIFIQSDRQGG